MLSIPGKWRGTMRRRRTGWARSRCACADPPLNITREVASLHAPLSGIAMAATIITNMRMVLWAGSNVAFKMVAGLELQVSGRIVCCDACDASTRPIAARWSRSAATRDWSSRARGRSVPGRRSRAAIDRNRFHAQFVPGSRDAAISAQLRRRYLIEPRSVRREQ